MIGIRPDSLATRLVTIQDSARLQEIYGDDGVPFILESRLPAEAVHMVSRCGRLTRRDLITALPRKRKIAFVHPSEVYGQIGFALGLWGVPVNSCEAYRDAHDVLKTWFDHQDVSKVRPFAKKWKLRSQNVQAVLDGVQQVILDGDEIHDNERFAARLNSEVERLRAWSKPLHERKLKHHHIGYLGETDVRTTATLVHAGDDVRRENLDHPCVDVLLAGFTEEQTATVLAKAFGDEVSGWYEAAVYAKAKSPGHFGELVRRKVGRASKKHGASTQPGGCRHCGLGLPSQRGKADPSDGPTAGRPGSGRMGARG
ncbi:MULTISPECIES: hypothetical protein [unclassified Streptomyces]|uniref:hypothetical protein n=1 Tax=unclassified Streptomyces TaxID=2593676 RepID=UPI002365CCB5|nr:MULTISPECIES: hypothetical protein [unclassified Streptomyces]MDF3141817.1 hypothetical protein [Streptomyces sp. T21Q-yed]WDF45106.1 hypothetical protein PBV52_51315 [Streptomyces sp. T12]